MVSAQLRVKALTAYREALRSTKVVFQHDQQLLHQSRGLIATGMRTPEKLYEQFPKIPRDSAEEQVQHLIDVSKFLKSNVVQGATKAQDTPAAAASTTTTIPNKKDTGLPVYHLKIHKDTELGDNDSIKEGKSTLKVGAGSGGCCGGSGKR